MKRAIYVYTFCPVGSLATGLNSYVATADGQRLLLNRKIVPGIRKSGSGERNRQCAESWWPSFSQRGAHQKKALQSVQDFFCFHEMILSKLRTE